MGSLPRARWVVVTLSSQTEPKRPGQDVWFHNDGTVITSEDDSMGLDGKFWVSQC